MKKWFGVAIAAVMLGGCDLDLQVNGRGPQTVGSGKVSTINRKLGSFKSVAVDGSIDADVTVGRASDALIRGDDNLIGLVKTEIRGDTLHIYLNGSYTTHNPITVTLSATFLEAASVSGSGDLAVHGVRGSSFNVSIAGSGDIKADGSTDRLDAKIAGSGDLALFSLRTSNASVNVTGSGDANVTVTGTLTASVTGSGDITYKGHPQHVDKAVTGSGDVAAGE